MELGALLAVAIGNHTHSGNYLSGGGYNPAYEPTPIEYIHEDYCFAPSGGTQRSKLSTSVSGLNGDLHKMNHKPELPIKSVIDNICKGLSLKMQELASLCGVTRKTVYNWIDRPDSLKAGSAERLFELNLISTELKQGGFELSPTELNLEVVNGKSLLDMLKQSPIDRGVVLFAASRLKMANTQFDDLADPFA